MKTQCYILLYSIQWGKETSTEWVVAMVTSFFQSVLLLQPGKVVLLALLFSLFIRKYADINEGSNITLAKERSASDQKNHHAEQNDEQPDEQSYLR